VARQKVGFYLNDNMTAYFTILMLLLIMNIFILKMVESEQRKRSKLVALEQVRSELQRKVASQEAGAGGGAGAEAASGRDGVPVAWRKIP
jgi:hypothetical protein